MIPVPALGPSTIPNFLSINTPSYYSVDKPTLIHLPYGKTEILEKENYPSPSMDVPLPPLPPEVDSSISENITNLATQILSLPSKGSIYAINANMTLSTEIPRINFTLGATWELFHLLCSRSLLTRRLDGVSRNSYGVIPAL